MAQVTKAYGVTLNDADIQLIAMLSESAWKSGNVRDEQAAIAMFQLKQKLAQAVNGNGNGSEQVAEPTEEKKAD